MSRGDWESLGLYLALSIGLGVVVFVVSWIIHL